MLCNIFAVTVKYIPASVSVGDFHVFYLDDARDQHPTWTAFAVIAVWLNYLTKH